MKEPIEPEAKSTSVTWTTFDKNDILETGTNTFYYKNYGPDEYENLSPVCKCAETEREFNAYQKYKAELKKWQKFLQNRIDREMGVEL